MIPKIMNFFWVGEKMSWLRYMTLESFCKTNPGWEVRLHLSDTKFEDNPWKDNHKQDFFVYEGADYLKKVYDLPISIVDWTPTAKINPVCQSDLFQWKLLGGEGGFYSDLDILYIKELNYEMVKDYDTLCCLRDYQFTIGFLGASPKNKFFQDVEKQAKKMYANNRYQSAGIEAVYENIKRKCNRLQLPTMTMDIKKAYPTLRLINLPDEVIYPWGWQEASVNIFQRTLPLTYRTVGLHWYAGHAVSQQYNSLMQEHNWQSFRNTYTQCLKEL